MMRTELLIVGAGPAGMAAAIAARRHGLDVVLVDEQPTPGGQIWRSVDMTARRDDVLGASYVEGRAVVAAFRASGAIYRPRSHLWQLDPGFRAYLRVDGRAQEIEAKAVILATGAQERPIPFPGWTLPGVLTVGAAQILLKNAGQVPSGRVWIAGCGPLPLLYAVQLLRAGGEIAGYLDTTPVGQWRAALPHLAGALHAPGELLKGLNWIATLRQSGIPLIRGVSELEGLGNQRLEALRYRAGENAEVTAKADALLVHEGVVPSLHATLATHCAVAWDPAQDCYAPILDDWGESSRPGLFIAGDGAGIAGARAAQLRGELAALGVAAKLGHTTENTARAAARRIGRMLERETAIRPFLDALFRPRSQVFAPADRTLVCRCEEITAAQIKACAAIGLPGPNQVKAATRAGMGPCQGRQCGYTVMRIIAATQNRAPPEVGFFHVRSPLKPVTLGEVAALHEAVARRPQTGAEE